MYPLLLELLSQKLKLKQLQIVDVHFFVTLRDLHILRYNRVMG